MKTGKNYKFWFCTGSQDLYGDECLQKVAEHSKIIVEKLYTEICDTLRKCNKETTIKLLYYESERILIRMTF